MELKSGLSLEQKQVLSARQVQSLDILAYTNQELEDFLVNEYLENPMLENTFDKENDMLVDVERLYERGTSYKDLYLEEQDEDEHRRNDIKAVTENELKDYLLNQLNRGDFTEKQWKIMEYLIECLDPGGYFQMDLAELADSISCDRKEMEDCLNVLKELEPAGIFSKDLAECLERQLMAKGQADEMICRLLREYLKELMGGQIGVISRALHISTAKVKEYIHLLGNLNPRPVMNIQSEEKAYIVPDIIVSKHGDHWEVSINDKWMGEYQYSDYYMRMMEETKDPQLFAYFKERLERARFVVSCVEQRRKTILQIVETVICLQSDYFENGGDLKPMQLEDVAKALGIHVSTVSRAIKGKYIQYRKSVLLKSLFSAAVSVSAPNADGREQDGCGENGESKSGVSAEKIKNRIRQLIDGEGAKPLSDQKIADLLGEEGISVSRRAVAKYRIQMGIPDSRQRGLMG